MPKNVKEVDNGWNALRKRLRALAGVSASVGIQGAEAREQREGGISNVEVATTHEFGAPEAGIPQRSFMRSTFDENRGKYERQIERGAKQIVDGRTTPRAVMFRLGETARKDVIAKIDSNVPPPLSEATVASKGGDRQALVDKGVMRASVTSVVKGG